MSSTLVATFTQSDVFAGIYFYTHFLIIVAVVFGAIYFAPKLRLLHQSYHTLHQIENQLGKIVLTLDYLKKHHQTCEELHQNKDDPYLKSQLQKLQPFTPNAVKLFIDDTFTNIHTIINNHQRYLHNKINSMNEKYNSNLSYQSTKYGNINISSTTDIGPKNQLRMQHRHRRDLDCISHIVSTDLQTNLNDLIEAKSKSQINNVTINDIDNHLLTFQNTNNEKDCVRDCDCDYGANSESKNNCVEHMHDNTESCINTNDSNNIIKNTNEINDTDNPINDERADKIVSFIEMHIVKHQLSSKKGFWLFCSVIYRIKGLLLPAFTHFFDTATDIALTWQWYLLYQIQLKENPMELQNIDMFAFFINSIIVLIYYRISSAFEVWQFTRNKNDAILQFLFDFFLIKLIYINIFKMRSYIPSQVIKQFRMIEGGNESAFQAILTLVFLIKTQFNQASLTVILSFAASLLSLISRLSVLDKNSLVEEARKVKNISITDFCNPKLLFCIKMHPKWLFHRLFRSMEIVYSIFLISLFWDIVGGKWLFFLFIVALINMYVQYQNSGQIRTDWFNYILVTNITEIGQVVQRSKVYCNGGCNKYTLMVQLQLRLYYIRTVMAISCVVVLYMFTPISTSNHADNYSYSDTQKLTMSLFLWIVHIVVIIMNCIIIKFMTINDLHIHSQIENFRVLDYIGNDNQECVWFCKYLKCNIFSNHKRLPLHECRCYKRLIFAPQSGSRYDNCTCTCIKPTKPKIHAYNEPSNVLEAMLKSNNFEYWDVIAQWYCDLNSNINSRSNSRSNSSIVNLTFEKYLKNEIHFDEIFAFNLCYNNNYWDFLTSMSLVDESSCLYMRFVRCCEMRYVAGIERLLKKYKTESMKLRTFHKVQLWNALASKNLVVDENVIKIGILLYDAGIYAPPVDRLSQKWGEQSAKELITTLGKHFGDLNGTKSQFLLPMLSKYGDYSSKFDLV